MLIRKLQIVFMFVLFGVGLTACGDSDSESTDKSQPTAPAVVVESAMVEEAPTAMVEEAPVSEVAPGKNSSDGSLPAYDPDHPLMIMEDNGVVSEEEIYRAWPKEAPAASVD